ncbi:MAG: phosphonate ABC transporter, permease protein PhnE [Phenylobacterium sp.]|uniref:phosphonate ABC transporter, permease protein PhnE n=1 Tax=Phenylobacterium sp. TaxID=1871053 RepID=UPI003018DEF4
MSPDDAIADFEAARRRQLRRQWLKSSAGLLISSLLLAAAFHQSQFFTADIGGDPARRILDFLTRLVPELRGEVLFRGTDTPGSLSAWFYDLPRWLDAIRETLEMAALATVFGAIGATLASFLCARNLMPWAPVRFVVRRALEVIRTLPDLVLALILVAAFGAGPTAGVIALTVSTVGSLGKLFAEINEEVDPRQLEALDAAGAGLLTRIRFGLIPQVLPNYASYSLLRLEGNVAAAGALGIVGAGGIGLELQRAITYTEFSTYLAILLLLVSVIFVIDITSEAIRHRLILSQDREP